MRRSALLCLTLLPALWIGWRSDLPSRADTPQGKSDTKTARKIAPFRLPDTSGKTWDWNTHKGARATVVVFLGTQCPINNEYTTRLAELHANYDCPAIAFVAINSNCQDTPAKVAVHAREFHLPFPVLKDLGNVVADNFQARRTPEAFVLGPDGTIHYQGRIDDQVGYNYKRPAPTQRYLADALDEMLAGQSVSRPTVPALGCLIARVAKPKTDGTVTYTKHVSRILQTNCQECHRPGQIGPMSLLTYTDAQSWSETIREVVEERRMPPWHADPKHGQFKNDRRLSDADRKTLLGWIDQGCPKGEDRDLPPAKTFSTDWTIGKPDVIFTMPRAFTVPASGGKNGIKYQYFRVETNFQEDRWVQAAEARPGNRAVVHHIIVYALKLEKGMKRDRTDDIGAGFLTAWAPGDLPSVFPPGAAKKVPKGATLIFQMHYTPNGVEQDDRSSLALIFSKTPPKYEVRTRSIAQRLLLIPPGAANYTATSATKFTRDAQLLSMFPHMHLRGKDFQYRIVFPDGKSETLLSVPRYDFGWQSNYLLKERVSMPAGTRIECTAHFDNSDRNPNNPNSSSWVTWGDQTWEEMMIGFVDYVYVGDGEKK